ncbi:MAG: HAD family hydrolase [Planctomycetes bacterium]|nr:HAD family hydrolase [Planctomycetota bacterium]
MSFRAVVFDLDGTLLNSLLDIADAANAVLGAHGFPTHPTDAYRYFVGDGVRILIERVVPASCRDDAPQLGQLIREFTDIYRQTWNVRSHVYDGVAEMLHAVADRKMAMAVLSNKPHDATRQCVDYYFPGAPFAAVLGQQPGRPPKPDVTGALEIVQRLAVPAHSCLYLGDTAVDMETARRANMFPVGAAWGFRPIDELERAGAAAIIRHPLELVELLDGRRP